MSAKWKLAPNPPTSCPDLCLDEDSENYDEAHAQAVAEAYATAVAVVAYETGRWGLCPIASRWCIPMTCRPCRCAPGCGHDLYLPLPGNPAAAGCCDVFGKPLEGSNFAPFAMYCNGKPMDPARWRPSPGTCSVRVDSGAAAMACDPLGAWETGKPTFDIASQAWVPPTGRGLVAVGFYGECPTAADLLRIKQLTCAWARELAGVCDDEKKASSITQRGADGSVTLRFDDDTVLKALAKASEPADVGAAGGFGLTVLTSPNALIEQQHCELVAA